MFPNKRVALVEGANIATKHAKPNNDTPEGGIIKKEAPINLSNLMLVDNKGNASKIGVKPIHGPELQGDVNATLADISKIKEELGWDYTITIQEWLKNVISSGKINEI